MSHSLDTSITMTFLRSNKILAPKDNTKDITNNMMDIFEDDMRIFSATTEADNTVEDTPACNAKDTTTTHQPNAVLSDAEDSSSTALSDTDDSSSELSDAEAPEYNVMNDHVSADVEDSAGVVVQREGVEGGEVDTNFDTDTTGDSDRPFDTIFSDGSDSSSDSDNLDNATRATIGYLSDGISSDDYASDTDDSSDDLLHWSDGGLSDQYDSSSSDDEFDDTDSTTSDD